MSQKPSSAAWREGVRGLPDRWRASRSQPFKPSIGDLELEERGEPTTWQSLAAGSTIGLFVIAAAFTAYVAQPILVPVVLAWAVGTILLPLIDRVEAFGVPRSFAAIASALGLLVVLVTLLSLLSVPLAYWLGRASELGDLIRQKLESFNQPMLFIEEIGKALSQVTGGDTPALRVDQGSNIVKGIFAVLSPAVSQMILFFGALVFFLIYRQEIKTAAIAVFRERASRLTALRILTDTEQNMSVYFGTFTLVNLCLGIVAVGLTYVVGLPNPLLWGVLAALLNYIPYIGVAIVTATLLVVGVLTFPTLGQAAIAPLAYMAITTIEGHFITPTVIGHRLTMNPFLVFVAIAFWTWMWGPIGAFLAVPLVMTGTVIARHILPVDSSPIPG